MHTQLYSIALGTVAAVALQRAVYVHYVFFRRFLAYRKRAIAAPNAWRDYVTYAEPTLLLALTLYLWMSPNAPADPTVLQLGSVSLSAAVALGALALQFWCLLSFPTMSVGHYVLPEQRLVTSGPYAYVRHPIYTQAIAIWISVALAFASPAVVLLTIAYVVPAYWIYSRSEERMLVAHFGDSYQEYVEETGSFLPRFARYRSDVSPERSAETTR